MNHRRMISINPNTMIDMDDYIFGNLQPLKTIFYSKQPGKKPTLFYFPNDLEELPTHACAIENGIEPDVGEYVLFKMSQDYNDVIKFVKTNIQPNTVIWYLTKDRGNKIDFDNILSITDSDFQKYISSVQTTGDEVKEEIDCMAYVERRYLPIINEMTQPTYIFRQPRDTIINQINNELRFANRFALMKLERKLSKQNGDTIDIPPLKIKGYDIETPTYHFDKDDVSISESESEDDKPATIPFKYNVIDQGNVPSTQPKTTYSSALTDIKNKTTKSEFSFETPNDNRTMNPAQRQQNIMNQTFISPVMPISTKGNKQKSKKKTDARNKDVVKSQYTKQSKGESPKQDFP